jgi:hypothetical protein
MIGKHIIVGRAQFLHVFFREKIGRNAEITVHEKILKEGGEFGCQQLIS